ncbi:MAG TPA: BlaI/MecI/CopY family transcriptional regulator [Chitinophagaceae bacterium]|jgi:predicted transcriptional regulator|nr:BlaI/MecI/CopY family transcriptional regulator [Chitinophagaceae bacterium]
MAKHIRELTRVEEQIMQLLWDMNKGFVKDIVARFPDPKPAYSTVSTIVRILVEKGFVGYNAYGKTHQYYPVISREKYRGFVSAKLMSDYYDDSLQSLVSAFVRKKDIDIEEADEIIRLLQKFKKNQK